MQLPVVGNAEACARPEKKLCGLILFIIVINANDHDVYAGFVEFVDVLVYQEYE